MSAETDEYVRLTALMYGGHELTGDFERRTALAEQWPLELVDVLDDAARRRADQLRDATDGRR